MDSKEQLKTKGFVIFKNVYTPEEVKNLREILSNHFKKHGINIQEGKAQPNALLHVPELNNYIFNNKIISALKEVLDEDELMFTFHSDIHKSLKSGWHKDDGTSQGLGYFGKHTYEYDDCQVIKIGVYLQNHNNNKGGLTVKPGSHRHKELSFGKDEYIPTKAGDVVAFDVRINHTGQIKPTPYPFLNKVINKFNVNPQRAKKISDRLFGDRYAMFFTYGKNNRFTKTFAKGNMLRQEAQTDEKIFISQEFDKVLNEKKILNPFKEG